MEMINTLTGNWNLMRILRMTMGIIALGRGAHTDDLLIGIAGVFLLFMALANIGCSGVGGCGTSPSARKAGADEQVSFETVNDK